MNEPEEEPKLKETTHIMTQCLLNEDANIKYGYVYVAYMSYTPTEANICIKYALQYKDSSMQVFDKSSKWPSRVGRS